MARVPKGAPIPKKVGVGKKIARKAMPTVQDRAMPKLPKAKGITKIPKGVQN
jgi:hypothetical protein